MLSCHSNMSVVIVPASGSGSDCCLDKICFFLLYALMYSILWTLLFFNILRFAGVLTNNQFGRSIYEDEKLFQLNKNFDSIILKNLVTNL